MRARIARMVGLLALLLALGVSIAPTPSTTPTVEAAWSVGMFTIDRCGGTTQQHCRWVATELNFHPNSQCTYITFKGRRVGPWAMTMEVNSSKPGHKTYGWGVETRFAATNWDWRTNSHWRLHKC